jgi:hypothetical protein
MSDSFSQQVGHISVGITRKKTIDTWKFGSPFAGSRRKLDGASDDLEVEVSMQKIDGNRLEFVATGKWLRQALRNTDINLLKDAVEAELRFQHNMLSKVEWDDWLQVRVVQRSDGYTGRAGGASAGLEITYARMKRGVDPDTGEVFTIGSNGFVVDFPLPKKAGELDIGDELDGFKTGRPVDSSYSFIPATVENIAALDDMISKLDQLRKRLADYLDQDTIYASLSSSANGLAALSFS